MGLFFLWVPLVSFWRNQLFLRSIDKQTSLAVDQGWKSEDKIIQPVALQRGGVRGLGINCNSSSGEAEVGGSGVRKQNGLLVSVSKNSNQPLSAEEKQSFYLLIFFSLFFQRPSICDVSPRLTSHSWIPAILLPRPFKWLTHSLHLWADPTEGDTGHKGNSRSRRRREKKKMCCL